MKTRINLGELKAGVRNLSGSEMQGVVGGRAGALTTLATKQCNKIKKKVLRALCKAAVTVLI